MHCGIISMKMRLIQYNIILMRDALDCFQLVSSKSETEFNNLIKIDTMNGPQ